jgi:flagellar biosynthesis/type III secretory pathway chaperone
MSIRKFAELLSFQLLLLEKIEIVMEQETEALSNINLDKLPDINLQKADLSAEIEQTIVNLRHLMSEQATKAGLSPAATLGAIAEAIDLPEITALHKSLNTAAGKVRDTAAMNLEIAEHFAETAGSTLNVLTGLINQTSVYGSSGSYQQRSTGSMMINREA